MKHLVYMSEDDLRLFSIKERLKKRKEEGKLSLKERLTRAALMMNQAGITSSPSHHELFMNQVNQINNQNTFNQFQANAINAHMMGMGMPPCM